MGQHIQYLYQSEWVTEGSSWRPTPVTLYTETGAVLTSASLTTCVLTLIDLSGGLNAIVNAVEQVNIKNTGRGVISSAGLFTLTLLPADTAILVTTHPYELRRALIELTWASGAKADAVLIDFVVKNITRRPYVAP